MSAPRAACNNGLGDISDTAIYGQPIQGEKWKIAGTISYDTIGCQRWWLLGVSRNTVGAWTWTQKRGARRAWGGWSTTGGSACATLEVKRLRRPAMRYIRRVTSHDIMIGAYPGQFICVKALRRSMTALANDGLRQ